MKSYSQAGQDLWVVDLIGDTGFFVDVGAHDGLVHSNTYALEQLGWDGFCIEPNRDVYETLRQNRRTAYPYAIAASDRSGVAAFNGVQMVPGAAITSEAVPVAPLTALLGAGAPPVIDYLSIDVEGHELEVLAGMDFDRWKVRLITIEHNLYCDGPMRKDIIHWHLTALGFERMVEDVVAEGYGPYEDWYANVD